MISLPIVETLVGILTAVLRAGGLPALFALMVVESLGIPPLPSEVILPFAGFLVASGVYGFVPAFAAALAGGVVGAFLAYALGRYGRRWLERSGTGGLRLDPKHLAAMDSWFARHGEPTVGVARLLPIVRAYISYPAGTARMSPTRFGVYTALGAAPFTAGLIYAGYVLGKHWSELQGAFRILDYVAVVFLAGLALYVALRWRHVITPGFPPRLTRNTGSPRPAEDGPP
ncbi:MAG: DedA family protein [Thermoplasmata archaeon]|nr:DedA family protein [Thermoplasmata archaeon]